MISTYASSTHFSGTGPYTRPAAIKIPSVTANAIARNDNISVMPAARRSAGKYVITDFELPALAAVIVPTRISRGVALEAESRLMMSGIVAVSSRRP